MSDKFHKPKWLDKLQANSWQIELLISGGIVYTLYQLPNTFSRYFILAYEQTVFSDYVLLILVSAYLMTRLLLIGFSVNLVLRAVWVAYIGIHATLPGDINYENPRLGSWLDRRFPPGQSNRERLEKLDAACNLSYSLAILMCLITVSLIILMTIAFFIIAKFAAGTFMNTPWFKYTMVGVIVLLILGVFERVFYRLFRNWPKVQKALARSFKVLDYFTLSFLYKREWLVLISNVRVWKIQSLLLVYFTISMLVSINQIGSYLNLQGFFHYDPLDQRDYTDIPVTYEYNYSNYYSQIPEQKFALRGCIETDRIPSRYSWLFVSYWKDMDYTLDHYLEKHRVARSWEEIESRDAQLQSDSLYRVALSDMINVYIDEVLQDSLIWHEHQLTKTAERGWIAYFDTESLRPGEHRLRVTFNALNWRDEFYERSWMWVPFVKD